MDKELDNLTKTLLSKANKLDSLTLLELESLQS